MKKALILSGIAWDTTLQRHHKIAKWLKELGYEVYFIESIPSSSLTISKLINKIKSKFCKKNPIHNEKIVNVIYEHFLTPNYIFNLYNKSISNKIIKKIGKEFDIVVNYLPVFTTDYIIKNINYSYLIYDCVRDFENWGGYPKNIKKYEKKLKEISSVVLTDSYYLTNKHSGIQFLPSVSKEQFEVFKKNNRKIDHIKNIVYFGHIDKHIDLEILELLSQNYNLHIIGSSNITLNFEYTNHGFISDKEELAKKICEFDAIIIPYKGNMNGVIPAKFMESLASKLPVFISSFYDSDCLSDYCYVYHDKLELLNMLDKYNINNRKNPDKIIEKNTEDVQFNKFKEIINENK